MEPSIDLQGKPFALTAPVETDTGSYRLLRDPIDVATYAAFLNEIGHAEPPAGPDYINLAPYEAPIWEGDGWTARLEYVDVPMHFVTFVGADAFANHHGLRLISEDVWDELVRREAPSPPYDPVALNVEESSRLIPSSRMPDTSSGARGLFGNVSFWGDRIDLGYAWCFGVGWNKSRHLFDGPMKKRRWVRDASVSTGIRLMAAA